MATGKWKKIICGTLVAAANIVLITTPLAEVGAHNTTPNHTIQSLTNTPTPHQANRPSPLVPGHAWTASEIGELIKNISEAGPLTVKGTPSASDYATMASLTSNRSMIAKDVIGNIVNGVVPQAPTFSEEKAILKIRNLVNKNGGLGNLPPEITIIPPTSRASFEPLTGTIDNPQISYSPTKLVMSSNAALQTAVISSISGFTPLTAIAVCLNTIASNLKSVILPSGSVGKLTILEADKALHAAITKIINQSASKRGSSDAAVVEAVADLQKNGISISGIRVADSFAAPANGVTSTSPVELVAYRGTQIVGSSTTGIVFQDGATEGIATDLNIIAEELETVILSSGSVSGLTVSTASAALQADIRGATSGTSNATNTAIAQAVANLQNYGVQIGDIQVVSSFKAPGLAAVSTSPVVITATGSVDGHTTSGTSSAGIIFQDGETESITTYLNNIANNLGVLVLPKGSVASLTGASADTILQKAIEGAIAKTAPKTASNVEIAQAIVGLQKYGVSPGEIRVVTPLVAPATGTTATPSVKIVAYQGIKIVGESMQGVIFEDGVAASITTDLNVIAKNLGAIVLPSGGVASLDASAANRLLQKAVKEAMHDARTAQKTAGDVAIATAVKNLEAHGLNIQDIAVNSFATPPTTAVSASFDITASTTVDGKVISGVSTTEISFQDGIVAGVITYLNNIAAGLKTVTLSSGESVGTLTQAGANAALQHVISEIATGDNLRGADAMIAEAITGLRADGFGEIQVASSFTAPAMTETSTSPVAITASGMVNGVETVETSSAEISFTDGTVAAVADYLNQIAGAISSITTPDTTPGAKTLAPNGVVENTGQLIGPGVSLTQQALTNRVLQEKISADPSLAGVIRALGKLGISPQDIAIDFGQSAGNNPTTADGTIHGLHLEATTNGVTYGSTVGIPTADQSTISITIEFQVAIQNYLNGIASGVAEVVAPVATSHISPTVISSVLGSSSFIHDLIANPANSQLKSLITHFESEVPNLGGTFSLVLPSPSQGGDYDISAAQIKGVKLQYKTSSFTYESTQAITVNINVCDLILGMMKAAWGQTDDAISYPLSWIQNRAPTSANSNILIRDILGQLFALPAGVESFSIYGQSFAIRNFSLHQDTDGWYNLAYSLPGTSGTWVSQKFQFVANKNVGALDNVIDLYEASAMQNYYDAHLSLAKFAVGSQDDPVTIDIPTVVYQSGQDSSTQKLAYSFKYVNGFTPTGAPSYASAVSLEVYSSGNADYAKGTSEDQVSYNLPVEIGNLWATSSAASLSAGYIEPNVTVGAVGANNFQSLGLGGNFYANAATIVLDQYAKVDGEMGVNGEAEAINAPMNIVALNSATETDALQTTILNRFYHPDGNKEQIKLGLWSYPIADFSLQHGWTISYNYPLPQPVEGISHLSFESNDFTINFPYLQSLKNKILTTEESQGTLIRNTTNSFKEGGEDAAGWYSEFGDYLAEYRDIMTSGNAETINSFKTWVNYNTTVNPTPQTGADANVKNEFLDQIRFLLSNGTPNQIQGYMNQNPGYEDSSSSGFNGYKGTLLKLTTFSQELGLTTDDLNSLILLLAYDWLPGNWAPRFVPNTFIGKSSSINGNVSPMGFWYINHLVINNRVLNGDAAVDYVINNQYSDVYGDATAFSSGFPFNASESHQYLHNWMGYDDGGSPGTSVWYFRSKHLIIDQKIPANEIKQVNGNTISIFGINFGARFAITPNTPAQNAGTATLNGESSPMPRTAIFSIIRNGFFVPNPYEQADINKNINNYQNTHRFDSNTFISPFYYLAQYMANGATQIDGNNYQATNPESGKEMFVDGKPIFTTGPKNFYINVVDDLKHAETGESWPGLLQGIGSPAGTSYATGEIGSDLGYVLPEISNAEFNMNVDSEQFGTLKFALQFPIYAFHIGDPGDINVPVYGLSIWETGTYNILTGSLSGLSLSYLKPTWLASGANSDPAATQGGLQEASVPNRQPPHVLPPNQEKRR